MSRIHQELRKHLEKLGQCKKCPAMHPPVVVGQPAKSEIILIGQAPGDKEGIFGKPFAWTAGKTMFKWFNEIGIAEENFRSLVYMAAVCRCFPGKKATGGDRVPNPSERENCLTWLEKEFILLKPKLAIPVGKLAIEQFLEFKQLSLVVGKQFRVKQFGVHFDLIPLPHPSGASPWHRCEPGKSYLQQALLLIKNHPSFKAISGKDP